MATEKILYTDNLRLGTDKLNKAIDQANKSEVDSVDAVSFSNEAKAIANTAEIKSNATATQLETIIIESGTSDAEVLAARTDGNTAETFPTVGGRLDNVTALLAETAAQEFVESELAKKRPNTGIMPINYSEWDNETKQKVTGGAIAVLGPNSAGHQEIIQKSIDESKTNFINIASKNLANPDKIRYGGYYAENAANLGQWAINSALHSIIIPTEAGKEYARNSASSVVHFSVNWQPHSGYIPSGSSVTIPVGAAYTAFNFHTASTPKTQINKGPSLLQYDDFRLEMPKAIIKKANIPAGEKLISGNNIDDVMLTATENLFDKDIVTQGYFDATGTFMNDAGYRVHPPIAVKEGYTYRALTAGHRALRNEYGQWVGNLPGSGNLKIPTGLGVKTIQPISTVGNLSLEMFVEGSVYPSNYIPNKKYVLDNMKFELRKASSPIRGIRWAAIGDSNTFASYSYVSQIADIYGAVPTNFGMNGRSAARRGGQTDIDIPPVVDMIYAVPTTNEIITVAVGVNDFHAQVPLGAENSTDVTTFNGALNSITLQLIERFPGKKIAFITPYQRRNSAIVRPITLPMYVEAVKKAAARFGIACFDLYANCGLYPNSDFINTTYYADADGAGLHPNAAGHRIAVPRIASFLEAL